MTPFPPMPTPTRREPSLRLIQGIAVAVLQRSRGATMQGLQILAALEPEEGASMLQALVTAMDPGDRRWLANVDGARART
jgi:hypothetical protein